MEVTFSEMLELMETLPIGYYAKRRVGAELSSTETATYYNPNTDKFVVSFPMLSENLAKFPNADEEKKEEILRGLYYHELSHAILTPKSLKMSEIMNIFEDERIETLLSNFYLNVNFKELVKLVNDFDGTATPTTPIQYFYWIVRFRIGPTHLVNQVDEIIKQYSFLTRNGQSKYRVDWYERRVMQFYNECCGSIPPPTSKNRKKFDSQFSDELSKEKGEQRKEEGQSKVFGTMHPEQIEEKMVKVFENAFNSASRYNDEMYHKLEVYFDSFNKKNSKGNSANGYSGIINPRNADRKDYKFFDRKINARSNNTFGSFHLNLFIDKSGSFEPNENLVNMLIGTLERFERKYPYFDFDIVFCGEGQYIAPKNNRVLEADNGNSLTDEIFSQFIAVQKPMTYNYNIVLFDGLATSERQEKNFGAFNKNNCTIISDPDNRKAINKYCGSAKTIITTNYTEELFSNICLALQKALN